VVDPGALLVELSELESRGVDTAGLLISADAHVDHAVPRGHRQGHRALPGKSKIGTTVRGIGPCYRTGGARRRAVPGRPGREILRQKVEAALDTKNQIVKVYNRKR